MDTAGDAYHFGRDIAGHAIAEIKATALKLDTVEAKEARLARIVTRAHRAISAAAMGRMAAGMSREEAAAWRRDAETSYHEAMRAEVASYEPAG
ncbi:hypothetical protein [Methylobacterium frigidaeris]|uniref:Uncharacterized protein n=1 Tax=Methylobacterium frigidaeris TaxID=2038277 RepID=A0AA37HF69_9HYPH|nr:hypothetical protein [Methylobacterium frigidaeris]GJD64416.1 hypothetical protein MPEAHAMD_4598 [Methylobacterium frigidaeris]